MRLGHYTISFETANRSRHSSQAFKPGTSIAGSDEHRHGRSLLTPDEIMRLGPTRPIVMIAGEPPYLLDRLDYRPDPACAGRDDPNPMHFPRHGTVSVVTIAVSTTSIPNLAPCPHGNLR